MVGRLVWIVAMAIVVFVAMACVPIAPPAETPVTEEQSTETVTETVAVATEGSDEGSAAESTSESTSESNGLQMVLTGTVTYRQRIALPAGSVIEVQLQDVSLQDVAATVIASQTITTAGENVPIPFELVYDPAQIDERMSYALSVRITMDGQLRWVNTERFAVLTNGAPITGIEVIVQPAQ